MTVETYDMRLEFLQDFGVSDATFTDVSAGSSSTITALLQTDYLLEETGGEVGVEQRKGSGHALHECYGSRAHNPSPI